MKIMKKHWLYIVLQMSRRGGRDYVTLIKWKLLFISGKKCLSGIECKEKLKMDSILK